MSRKVSADMFGMALRAYVRKVTHLPVIPKLTPNVTDVAAIAKSAEDAGADAVSLVNTFLGMAIDVETKDTTALTDAELAELGSAAFDALMVSIDRNPIPAPRTGDPRHGGPGVGRSAVIGALYSEDGQTVNG